LLNADVSDKVVEVTQRDNGWTPIVGINVSPSENLNIALKYEHKNYMVVINDTKADSLGLFRDGGKSRGDIPGILTAGIGYKPVRWLETQISFNYYFDKYVNWLVNVRELGAHNRKTLRTIDKGSYELALGLQFNISDKFALSTGILASEPGVNDSFQSDFSYTNPSVTAAGGLQWKITDALVFDLGFMNTFYRDVTVSYEDADIPGGNYSDTLGKTSYVLSAGLSYTIFR